MFFLLLSYDIIAKRLEYGDNDITNTVENEGDDDGRTRIEGKNNIYIIISGND